MKTQLELINSDINKRELSRPLRKILPFLLVLSFMWLALFDAYSSGVSIFYLDISSTYVSDFSQYLFIGLIVNALLYWLWFEIVFYFYKFMIGFSVFSYTIPKALLENKARLFMVIRNVFQGLIYNLLFFIPQYISTYIVVFQIIIDMIVFIWFTKEVMKETVDVMIKPNVFRALCTSFVIIEAFSVIGLVMEVL